MATGWGCGHPRSSSVAARAHSPLSAQSTPTSGSADLRRDEELPLPDMAALDDELAAVRSHGYCVCHSFQPGRTSVAATVVGTDGQPVGALSLAGPNSTFPPVRLTDIGEAVTAAARVASRRLQVAHGQASRTHARVTTMPRPQLRA
jgi:DNA-binding IclR family transcriptional regulator